LYLALIDNDNTSHRGLSPPSYEGVDIINLNLQPTLVDYPEAMSIANKVTEESLTEHMLLSWYDRDRDFKSPQHAS
jgi:hypothetical protein